MVAHEWRRTSTIKHSSWTPYGLFWWKWKPHSFCRTTIFAHIFVGLVSCCDVLSFAQELFMDCKFMQMSINVKKTRTSIFVSAHGGDARSCSAHLCECKRMKRISTWVDKTGTRQFTHLWTPIQQNRTEGTHELFLVCFRSKQD